MITMPNNRIRPDLDNMNLADVYSLMLFLLYKIKDIPEYAVLSEMCYLLDSNGIQRILTYFAGKTIKVPTKDDFKILANALLLYQSVNIDRKSFTDSISELDLTAQQKEEVTDLYVKIIPIVNNYNIDRSQVQKNAR